MSSSGLHSFMCIWHRGMVCDGGIYLVSLIYFWLKFMFSILVKCWCCFRVFECSIVLVIKYCGLWRFGCSKGTIFFALAICCKLLRLEVSIGIGRMCIFS